MRFSIIDIPHSFSRLTAIVLFNLQTPSSEPSSAKSIPLEKRLKLNTQPSTLTTQDSPVLQSQEKATDEVKKPFRLSSRFHLKKGTNQGVFDC